MWAERIEPDNEEAIAQALSQQEGFAWLDSRRPEASDGRYSFLAAWPDRELRLPFGTQSPFDQLGGVVEDATEPPAPGLVASEVPLWIGYIAYDAYWSQPLTGSARFDRDRAPILLFRRYPALIAVDHEEGSLWIVGDDANACDSFRERLHDLNEVAPGMAAVGPLEIDDATGHRRAIERALDYIGAGDVYEVNLARRWSARFEGPAFELWRAMRRASRVPLGMFFDGGDHALLACTMERFLRWDRRSRRLWTRPIKGTIARRADHTVAREELSADPKERAEHTMIVDLMRNDLGRVAEVGTVQVESPLVVEPFTGLYHLVTTVTCVTRSDSTIPSILDATFPPGSVTGAPKLRALEIIEELERHPRGPYCGAVGFIDRDGGLSLGVAIRTAVVGDGTVRYWAGGGIVEASDPDREVAETELKAQVFLDAVASLGETHQ